MSRWHTDKDGKRRLSHGLDEEELDAAYRYGTAMDMAERAGRIQEYETSPAQREWEGHDDGCESEFIQEAGMHSPCRCSERADDIPPNAGSAS